MKALARGRASGPGSTGSLNTNIESDSEYRMLSVARKAWSHNKHHFERITTTTAHNFLNRKKSYDTKNTSYGMWRPAAPASSANPAQCVGPRREMNPEGARQHMFRAACAPLDERVSAVASPWGKVWRTRGCSHPPSVGRWATVPSVGGTICGEWPERHHNSQGCVCYQG